MFLVQIVLRNVLSGLMHVLKQSNVNHVPQAVKLALVEKNINAWTASMDIN